MSSMLFGGVRVMGYGVWQFTGAPRTYRMPNLVKLYINMWWRYMCIGAASLEL